VFVDFAAVKAATTMADVIKMLGLKLKQSGNQWRGICPTCKGAGERSLVITEGKGFFCFTAHSGGDQIALVAHITAKSAKDAAQEIAAWKGMIPGKTPATEAPESEAGGSETKKLAPLAYLEPEHDAVLAVGFDPEFAKAHGIGYAPKGMMRGTIAVPFRDEDGNLLGYLGIEEARLPADFMTNVVPLRKRA